MNELGTDNFMQAIDRYMGMLPQGIDYVKGVAEGGKQSSKGLAALMALNSLVKAPTDAPTSTVADKITAGVPSVIPSQDNQNPKLLTGVGGMDARGMPAVDAAGEGGIMNAASGGFVGYQDGGIVGFQNRGFVPRFNREDNFGLTNYGVVDQAPELTEEQIDEANLAAFERTLSDEKIARRLNEELDRKPTSVKFLPDPDTTRLAGDQTNPMTRRLLDLGEPVQPFLRGLGEFATVAGRKVGEGFVTAKETLEGLPEQFKDRLSLEELRGGTGQQKRIQAVRDRELELYNENLRRKKELEQDVPAFYEDKQFLKGAAQRKKLDKAEKERLEKIAAEKKAERDRLAAIQKVEAEKRAKELAIEKAARKKRQLKLGENLTEAGAAMLKSTRQDLGGVVGEGLEKFQDAKRKQETAELKRLEAESLSDYRKADIAVKEQSAKVALAKVGQAEREALLKATSEEEVVHRLDDDVAVLLANSPEMSREAAYDMALGNLLESYKSLGLITNPNIGAAQPTQPAQQNYEGFVNRTGQK